MSDAENVIRAGETGIADMDAYVIRIHAKGCRAVDVLASRKRGFANKGYTVVPASDLAECVAEQGFKVVRCACTRKEG